MLPDGWGSVSPIALLKFKTHGSVWVYPAQLLFYTYVYFFFLPFFLSFFLWSVEQRKSRASRDGWMNRLHPTPPEKKTEEIHVDMTPCLHCSILNPCFPGNCKRKRLLAYSRGSRHTPPFLSLLFQHSLLTAYALQAKVSLVFKISLSLSQNFRNRTETLSSKFGHTEDPRENVLSGYVVFEL